MCCRPRWVGCYDRPRPRQLAEPSQFHGVPELRPAWDFSRDGIMRSLDESLQRLGLDRIDIVYIHDPDDHWQEAIDDAYPALHDLRAQGVIGAIGAGMNQAEMLARFARETDMDVFLCAGRYTLLDQSALPELLPACEARGISLVIGGLLNSGILADPAPGARFDYQAAPEAVLARAQGIRDVCRRHQVPLLAAAMQFPLAHPRVASILAGVRRPAHLDDYPAGMRLPIPDALWDDLRSSGLIAPSAPTPVDRGLIRPTPGEFRLGQPGQGSLRIGLEQLGQGRLRQADREESVPERAEQVGVARTPVCREVARQAHVLGHQQATLETRVEQPQDPAQPSLRVPVVDALDGVELDPRTPTREALVIARVGDHVAVPDDDPARIDAFFRQQVQLRVAHGPSSGMRGDGRTGLSMGTGRGPEHAFLEGADVSVTPDLADDAGADARLADALR